MSTRLKICCIVSLVATAATTLYALMLCACAGLSDDDMKQLIDTAMSTYQGATDANIIKESTAMLFRMINNAWFYVIFNVVEVAGLILMLRRNVQGRNIYIASQVGIIYSHYIVFGMSSILGVDVLWIMTYVLAARELEDQD